MIIFGVSYRVIPPEDGQWGILKDDGNWTGMIGMLHRRVRYQRGGLVYL